MKKSTIKICPSILAGDFAYIADEAKRIEQSGADWLHIDVMDGHFVPNLTIGPQVVSAINRSTEMFLDVHLMMYNPYDYIEQFVQAGADMITFHFEATEDIEDTLQYIKRCNVLAGLAFRPETSVEFIPKYLPYCDMVLLMTVAPGFGGQSFIQDSLDKIRFVRNCVNTLGLKEQRLEESNTTKKAPTHVPYSIQVDGGINEETVRLCAEAGANVFVAGTYLFSQPTMKEGVDALRQVGIEHFCEKPRME